MKVVEQTHDRLVLQGIPTIGFSVLGLIVTSVLIAGCSFFLHLEWKASKGTANHHIVIIVLALLCILGLLALCVVLLFQRERLVIDRVTRSVVHTTWWVMGRRTKEKTYPLERVVGVSFEESERKSPGRGGGTTHTIVTRLLLEKPRAAIVLESSETGLKKNVRPTAEAVAAWLGVEITLLGKKRSGRRGLKSAQDS